MSTERITCAFDSHQFVGRIYDLSIVSLHFDDYDEIQKYPDCKYAIDVNYAVTALVERMKSINLAGDLLWLDHNRDVFQSLPVSEYDWLKIALDVFFMRFISIVDCALILANEVFELGQEPRKCSKHRLRKAGLPDDIISIIEIMEGSQEKIRHERNSRFHHGSERSLGADDRTFHIASLMSNMGGITVGKDIYGNNINLHNLYSEAAEPLRIEYNSSLKALSEDINTLFDSLEPQFELRFKPKYKSSNFNNGKRRN